MPVDDEFVQETQQQTIEFVWFLEHQEMDRTWNFHVFELRKNEPADTHDPQGVHGQDRYVQYSLFMIDGIETTEISAACKVETAC